MLKFSELLKPVIRGVVFGVGLGAVAACTAIYQNHGYVPTEQELAEVKVGVDTRDSVIETIGAPGAAGVVRDSGYYYVASRMRHYGALEPQVVSRQLVAISFDQRGVVKNVERFGLEDGVAVRLERRVTSSSIEDRTFLRQLLGNLGNFNPAGVVDQN